jgi:hypothetical protein
MFQVEMHATPPRLVVHDDDGETIEIPSYRSFSLEALDLTTWYKPLIVSGTFNLENW